MDTHRTRRLLLPCSLCCPPGLFFFFFLLANVLEGLILQALFQKNVHEYRSHRRQKEDQNSPE